MATTRTTWRLDGFSGSPGYVNFYMRGAIDTAVLDAAAAAQRTLLTAVSALWPTGVTLTCQSTATQFDEVQGTLITPVTIATVPTVFTGSGGSVYASPAGAVIVWRTAVLANRRLTTGRTFLVPCASPMYGPDGTLADTNRASLATAASAYVTRLGNTVDGHPVIWHRNAKGSANGYAAPVTAATVNDRVAMLTSRRAR